MTSRIVGFRHDNFPYNLSIEIKNNLITSITYTRKPVLSKPVSEFEVRVIETFRDYFSGNQVDPARLPSEPEGTPFQKRVWKVVRKIPYGDTRSYGEVAMDAGVEKGARAVGMAMRSNPVPIVIPCHRVVGKGWMGGYSPDISIKKFLLELEGVDLSQF